MVFSHVIGGMTFTEASFQGNAYADEATGFPKALEKMVEHVANAYHGTSSDPLTVGAGAKALTVSNGSGQIPAFSLGMPVRIARTSDPAGVWMQGEITVWDGATGIATINVDATKGSGSFSDWSIVIGGHLTTASGAPPLAVSQGGTGASTGKAALANLAPGVSGIIETNANFVDAAIFGPALDPVDWSSRTAAATSSLMLATVEDGGADAEVNIWDLTDDNLTGATPLATVSITGAAAPTSIAVAMGYIIAGHEDGITIIDPHDGAWAERTVGWPRSLSTATTPDLTNNDVQDVAAGYSDMPVDDPRTGGPIPSFGVAYGTGSDAASLIKDDGNVYDWAGTVATNPQVIITDTGRIGLNRTSAQNIEVSQVPITNITADDWGAWGTYTDTFKVSHGWSEAGNLMAAGYTDKLYQMLLGGLDNSSQAQEVAYAHINRTYNTGYMAGDIRGAWLANAKTADRSYKTNTLTENGTVTEATVETGAELKGYSGWSASNYLNRAAGDPDFEMGTADFSITAWVKNSGMSGGDYDIIVMCEDPGGTSAKQWTLAWDDNGELNFRLGDGGSVFETISPVQYDDNAWHMVVAMRDATADETRLYVDGVLVKTGTNANTTLTDVLAQFRIGLSAAGGRPNEFGTSALIRVSKTLISATHVRQMYEAERGKFGANAKCLLQSGSTDAVLDVSVDPITSKVAVTQADSVMIWNGLIVESEPTIAAGGTAFEHNLLYGGDRVEINDANLSATIAAKDLREDMEILRGLKAGLPACVDLSKAKAWIEFNGAGTIAINASYNIKGISDLGTGSYEVFFAVPFKSRQYAAIGSAGQTNNDYMCNFYKQSNKDVRKSIELATTKASTGALVDNSQIWAIFFGELQNE